MIPCISQVTTLPSPFAEDVVNYAAAGCRTIEVWLTKLEQHLEQHSAESTTRLVADHGVSFAAAAYQGGLLQGEGEGEGEERAAHLDHFRRRLEICQHFAIPTLLVVADFVQGIGPRAIDLATARLAEAARWAAVFGVRLALEFRGDGNFCTNLDTAISLVEGVNEPNLGICLDVFHYYKGSSKLEDLERLAPGRLFHVQLCDVPGVPREWMRDSDRVLPGDGDFQLDLLISGLRKAGYVGAVSLELVNPVLWRSNPKQLVELGLTALERILAAR